MAFKTILNLGLISGIVILLAGARTDAEEVFKTRQDKASYGIGVDAARNLKRQGVDVNIDLLIKGMKDELSGSKLLISEQDLRKTLDGFQTEQRLKQRQAIRTASIEKNKKEGDAFLAQNKTKEGVATLPSGLQYKILKSSDGRLPAEGNTVEFHYRGTFINGKEFDSSYSHGKPISFTFTGLTPGWTEALKLMPVGSKWQLVIPPHLGYGVMGAAGRKIPPSTTLIFEVEVLAIK